VTDDIRARVEQLEPAASERDSIAALVSDRPEVGTYGKVEGLLAHVQQLEQVISEAVRLMDNDSLGSADYLLRHALTPPPEEPK